MYLIPCAGGIKDLKYIQGWLDRSYIIYIYIYRQMDAILLMIVIKNNILFIMINNFVTCLHIIKYSCFVTVSIVNLAADD